MLDRIGLAAALDDYLSYENRARKQAWTDCDFQRDEAWSIRTSSDGRKSQMPLLVSHLQMVAAHQHLRGLAVLLRSPDGVDLAVDAVARGCVEASARALWVVDATASSSTRVGRALNIAWQDGKTTRASIAAEARRLSIPLTTNKRGEVTGVLASPNRVDLLAAALSVLAVGDTWRTLWSRWSQSAHGHLAAAVTTFLHPGELTGVAIDAAAQMAAMTHLNASARVAQYLGQPANDPERQRNTVPIGIIRLSAATTTGAGSWDCLAAPVPRINHG